MMETEKKLMFRKWGEVARLNCYSKPKQKDLKKKMNIKLFEH